MNQPDFETKIEQKPTSARYQFLAAFFVDFLSIGYGITFGWTSPSLVQLQSDDSPLPTGKITVEEASWVASLVNLGGMMGISFWGWITNRYGRKMPLVVITIPTIASWVLVLYAQNVYYLYVSRLLMGWIAASHFIIIPIFFTEIALTRVRGLLGSTILFCFNTGMLIAYVLGNFCDFYVTPVVAIALLAICGVSLMFFPESPTFLVRQNKIEQAERSLRFYRSMHGNEYDASIQQELNRIKMAIGANDDGKSKPKSMKWSDLVTGPGRKAVTLGIVLATLARLTGCQAILTYTANIFEMAGSNLPPNICAILVGVMQFSGSLLALTLVERAGRKILFIASGIGTALGLVILAIYIMLKSWNYDVESFNWIPLASVCWTIGLASLSILSLPFIYIAEIMPENIKDFAISFCSFLFWFFSFLTTFFLPFWIETFTFHGTLLMFAGVAVLCVVYLCVSMPETKGKTREEIMKLLE